MKNRLPLVLSTTALLVAVLGATPIGEAAKEQLVPRGSVGTNQIRDNAVISRKVKNRSLLAVDFRLGQLPRGAQGRVGPPGPPGPVGPVGPQGAAGVSAWQPVFATSVNDSSSFKSLSAPCPSGKRALGGGAAVAPSNSGIPVALQVSYFNGTAWTASARETATFTGNWNLNVVAICATVP